MDSIFSTPSSIFKLAGSPGMALVLWVIAGAIATCGSMVMLEFGSGIPRSGGIKIYLERSFSPTLLWTCVYLFYCVFLRGSPSPISGCSRAGLMARRGLRKQRHNISKLPPPGRRHRNNDLESPRLSYRSHSLRSGHPHRYTTRRTVVTRPPQRGETVHLGLYRVHWLCSTWRAFADS